MHMMTLELPEIVARYARGLFPMEDGWYAADPRAVLPLDADSLAAVRRRLRRSLRERGSMTLRLDEGFRTVVAECARPRSANDGVWLKPWIAEQYALLHGAGLAHTFEIWDGERLAAGMIGVTLGRAAFLESMFHVVPHAGNVLLVRTLEHLAASGFELCDIQTPTDHTHRLGAVQLRRDEFERRLRDALA
jgi:leucyl/phenylalanyl-tRNA---protein transferase